MLPPRSSDRSRPQPRAPSVRERARSARLSIDRGRDDARRPRKTCRIAARAVGNTPSLRPSSHCRPQRGARDSDSERDSLRRTSLKGGFSGRPPLPLNLVPGTPIARCGSLSLHVRLSDDPSILIVLGAKMRAEIRAA